MLVDTRKRTGESSPRQKYCDISLYPLINAKMLKTQISMPISGLEDYSSYLSDVTQCFQQVGYD